MTSEQTLKETSEMFRSINEDSFKSHVSGLHSVVVLSMVYLWPRSTIAGCCSPIDTALLWSTTAAFNLRLLAVDQF